jgi:hypothetical protein
MYNCELDEKKNSFKSNVIIEWDLNLLKIKFQNKFSGNIILSKKTNGTHTTLFIINKLSWDIFLS